MANPFFVQTMLRRVSSRAIHSKLKQRGLELLTQWPGTVNCQLACEALLRPDPALAKPAEQWVRSKLASSRLLQAVAVYEAQRTANDRRRILILFDEILGGIPVEAAAIWQAMRERCIEWQEVHAAFGITGYLAAPHDRHTLLYLACQWVMRSPSREEIPNLLTEMLSRPYVAGSVELQIELLYRAWWVRETWTLAWTDATRSLLWSGICQILENSVGNIAVNECVREWLIDEIVTGRLVLWAEQKEEILALPTDRLAKLADILLVQDSPATQLYINRHLPELFANETGCSSTVLMTVSNGILNGYLEWKHKTRRPDDDPIFAQMDRVVACYEGESKLCCAFCGPLIVRPAVSIQAMLTYLAIVGRAGRKQLVAWLKHPQKHLPAGDALKRLFETYCEPWDLPLTPRFINESTAIGLFGTYGPEWVPLLRRVDVIDESFFLRAANLKELRRPENEPAPYSFWAEDTWLLAIAADSDLPLSFMVESILKSAPIDNNVWNDSPHVAADQETRIAWCQGRLALLQTVIDPKKIEDVLQSIACGKGVYGQLPLPERLDMGGRGGRAMAWEILARFEEWRTDDKERKIVAIITANPTYFQLVLERHPRVLGNLALESEFEAGGMTMLRHFGVNRHESPGHPWQSSFKRWAQWLIDRKNPEALGRWLAANWQAIDVVVWTDVVKLLPQKAWTDALRHAAGRWLEHLPADTNDATVEALLAFCRSPRQTWREKVTTR